jgi:hypothetical protein
MSRGDRLKSSGYGTTSTSAAECGVNGRRMCHLLALVQVMAWHQLAEDAP